MKKLNTNPISDTSRFPVKKGTLQFIQDAHRETLAATIKALIGTGYDPAVVYVLSGMINIGTDPVFSVSAGTAFYNGEVYDFDGASFTATSGNTGVFSIGQTQYTTDADPVTFTDTTVRNVHDIYKMVLSQGAPGSGLANFSQAYFLSFKIPAQLNLTAPLSPSPYTDNISQVIGSYPNLFVYTPAPTANLFPIVASGLYAVGDVGPGGSSFTITYGASLPSGSYDVMGTIVSNGTFANDAAITWAVNNVTNAGFNVLFQEHRSVTQNISFRYYIIKL